MDIKGILGSYEEKLAIFIGILAVIVIIYRILFLAVPTFMKGFNKNDMKIMFESITLLV